MAAQARTAWVGSAWGVRCVGVGRRLGCEMVFRGVRGAQGGAIARYGASGFRSVARRVEYCPPSKRDEIREDALVMRCDLRLLPRTPSH